MGIPPSSARALRGQCGQDQPGGRRSPGGQAEGPLRRGDGHHADAARRGEDDDHRRPRAGPGLPRQAGDHRHPSGLHGPDLRDQGWRRRRWLQPGRPLREPQPAPDGRSPRGDGRQQSAGRHGRQPPAAGQRARTSIPTASPGDACSTSTTARCATSCRASARARTARRGRPASTSRRRPRSWPCWRWPRRCRICGRASGGSSSATRRRASR